MGTNINSESLNAMQQVDIRTVDKSALIDLNSVKIDESLPIPERVASFVSQIGNPSCFRVGDVLQYGWTKFAYSPRSSGLWRTNC